MESARQFAVLSLVLALAVSATGPVAYARSYNLSRMQAEQEAVNQITAAQSALRLADPNDALAHTRYAEELLLSARDTGSLGARQDRAITVLAQAGSDEQKGDTTGATATLNAAASDLE